MKPGLGLSPLLIRGSILTLRSGPTMGISPILLGLIRLTGGASGCDYFLFRITPTNLAKGLYPRCRRAMILANMVGRDAIMTQYQQPYDSSIKSLLEGSAAEMVSPQDKRRVEERLKMFDSLLEQNPYIQELKDRVAAEAEAKGKAEGKAEGEAEGEVKGLQVAVIEIVRRRFPALVDLTQQRVERFRKPDALSQFVGQISTAPDEATAAWLISTLAA